MNVIPHARALNSGGRPVCLAIGMFDGVHLGHQKVLGETIAQARQKGAWSVAITFDRHPNEIVAPQRTPLLIYPLAQRLRVMGELGLDATILIPFDREFSQQTGRDFIAGLGRDLGRINGICIGSNFTFGNKRSGNVALLKAMGAESGFNVLDLAPVSWQGTTVSSTRIREAIQRGDLTSIGAMLGRPYSIASRVVHGARLGQKIGFPTANLEVTGLVLLPFGVYAGLARTSEGTFKAVANLGQRPTVAQTATEVRLELHLLDFTGDLYEQEVEFQFLHRLRGEEKFPSLDALQRQIQGDVGAARQLLG